MRSAAELVRAPRSSGKDVEMTGPEFDDETEVIFIEAHQEPQHRRDQDGVAALRDVEAEEGEDEGVDDVFDMDDKAARESGALLDDRDEPEPGLN